MDALKDEISSLTLQNRSLEARNNNAIVAEEQAVENRRLTAENSRLVQEIEEYKAAVPVTERLRDENYHLASKSQHALQEQENAYNGEDNDSKLTPAPKNPSSSIHKVEYDGSEFVAAAVYHALVAKYNTLVQNWSDLKSARKKLDKTARGDREKVKLWINHSDALEKKIIKRDGKIQRLQEDIQVLKGQLGVSITTSSAPPSSSKGSTSITTMKEKHGKLADVASIVRSANLASIEIDGDSISIEGFLRFLMSPVLKETIAASCETRLGSGHYPEHLHGDANQTHHSDDHDAATRQEVQQEEMPMGSELDHPPFFTDSPRLPVPLEDGGKTINDTQFEHIVPHRSSSTEGDVELDTSNKLQVDTTSPKPLEVPVSSSDIPVVISSRSVSKKKGRKTVAGTSPRTRIKIETISSSPIGLSAFPNLEQSESVDLDEIGEKQITPRKQRSWVNNINKVRVREDDSGHRYQSESLEHSYPRLGGTSSERLQSIPIADAALGRKVSALQSLSTNRQILPRTSDERASKRRRVASDKVVEALLEDGENVNSAARMTRTDLAEPASLLGEMLSRPSPVKSPLPSQFIGRCNTITRKPKGSPSRFHGPNPTRHVPDLQDRENSSSTADFTIISMETKEILEGQPTSRLSSKKGSMGSVEPSRPISTSILGNPTSWSGPSSKNSPDSKVQNVELPSEISPSSLESCNSSKERSFPTFETKARQAPSLYPGQAATMEKLTVSKRLSLAAADVFNAEVDHPSNEPLRVRPLHKLTLDDFKINPNYNQGYKYAYSEVVRNKDDRRCLQGCTKPECCGDKFRALAKMSRDFTKPPSLSQEERDEELLEDFLGDNAYKLRNMSRAEREEILLQAQTRDLANKHGRHRMAYERKQSPPGFWRIDFPTTQEHEEDRARALEVERNTIKERYQEAMRANGRYMFRDE